jgi:HAD-superfamily hydrolase, subfamily IIB
MVALDLDGTTLNSSKEFSPRTIKAFHDAMEKGIHIVISTGRTFHSLPKQMFTIEGLEYVVTANGAVITRLADRQKIYENCVTPEAVDQLADILENRGFSVETFVDGTAYIDKAEYDAMSSNGSTYRDVDYVLTTRHPIPDLIGFMRQHRDHIENISLNFEFDEDRERMRPVLLAVEGITLTSSFAHNFEIGGATTSKAEALRHLMGLLGVSKEGLLACGDSPNDGQMIRLAGVGVVMGNSSDEMKKTADYVSDTNDNDGVAKAIEKFALGKTEE